MRALDGLVRLFVLKVHHARLGGIPLPESGPALVVANHVSGLDPLLLVAASRRPLRFMIATEQYERFGLKWLFHAARCIPVDRTHRPERALRHARSALRRGEVVALFPHGKIHLDSDPPRKLKRGFARLSEWAGAPVYPCRVEGVRGEGHTMLALLLPGEPMLKSHSATVCVEEDETACLDYIDDCINGRNV
jgi:1-acyl-sn-glycerol-3-phosphate acyltransferase